MGNELLKLIKPNPANKNEILKYIDAFNSLFFTVGSKELVTIKTEDL